MWIFRNRTAECQEAVAARRSAEQSLLDAQARRYDVEAKLIESRMVEEEIRAHNQSDTCTSLVESAVLGRRTPDEE